MKFEQYGAGPPVVLVHGLGASLFSWRDVVEALSPNFTTYTVDLLGFGESPAPAGFPYTIAAQAQGVATFMAAQGITDPILIGHSMGGGVCLHLADMGSRAVPAAASKMVLIAPVAYPPIHTLPQPGQAGGCNDAAGGLPLSPAHALARFFLSRAYAPGNRPTAAKVNGYAAGLSSPGQLEAFRMHGANLAGAEAPLPSFAGIANETLIVWGDQDRIVPEADGTRLATALPNATLRTIDDCGHVPHEEQPGTTIPVISGFLV